MNVQNYISIVSAVVASVSAFLAYNSFKLNKQNNVLTQTPVLLPQFSGQNYDYTVSIINDHKTGIAKDLSFVIEKGKLQRSYLKEKEFLAPGMKTVPVIISEDITGSSFKISYLNIFNKRIIVSGVVHYINELPDLQDVKFEIESVEG